ncbi:hypothetical protein ACIQU1_07070 [Streptomyces angustmyceticus]|uniref:hypothetical protein n=1 Tax=Streptomyces angustmyceticus TaxID=285578 RepID=UPI00344EF2BF
MANQYPGPPPDQPPGRPGQNPYAKPDGPQPAGAEYGSGQGGRPGEPGYGYPQPASPPPPQPGYGYPNDVPQPPPPGFPPGAPPQPGPGGFQSGTGGFQAGAGFQAGPQPGGMALSLGDIAVSGDTIMTPAGPMPLRGAVWTATDMSRTEEKMPAHAVVLAIVFFLFCLLGLLFLLMKERVTTGFVQVTVNSGGRHHSTMIPVQSREQVMFVLNQVNYARSLSV